MNLSLGLLPVLDPVEVEKAPLLAITPSLFFTASEISSSLFRKNACAVFVSFIFNPIKTYNSKLFTYL